LTIQKTRFTTFLGFQSFIVFHAPKRKSPSEPQFTIMSSWKISTESSRESRRRRCLCPPCFSARISLQHQLVDKSSGLGTTHHSCRWCPSSVGRPVQNRRRRWDSAGGMVHQDLSRKSKYSIKQLISEITRRALTRDLSVTDSFDFVLFLFFVGVYKRVKQFNSINCSPNWIA
jgi:hypothetical protein